MENDLFTRTITGPGAGGRAVLVGVELKGASTTWTIQDSLAELGRLARTAGLEVAGTTWQKLTRPNPGTWIAVSYTHLTLPTTPYV